MSRDEVELDAFLEELVESTGKRLRKNERDIARLKNDIALLKSEERKPRVSSSVLKVLRGKGR
jgi:hypothetical protein